MIWYLIQYIRSAGIPIPTDGWSITGIHIIMIIMGIKLSMFIIPGGIHGTGFVTVLSFLITGALRNMMPMGILQKMYA